MMERVTVGMMTFHSQLFLESRKIPWFQSPPTSQSTRLSKDSSAAAPSARSACHSPSPCPFGCDLATMAVEAMKKQEFNLPSG